MQLGHGCLSGGRVTARGGGCPESQLRSAGAGRGLTHAGLPHSRGRSQEPSRLSLGAVGVFHPSLAINL